MASNTTTVVTSYGDRSLADQAVDALRDGGFPAGKIKVLSGKGDALSRELAERGFGEAEVREFAEAAEQGRTLLAAEVTGEDADRAAEIMERFERDDAEARPGSRARREQTVPIVEEELEVETSKVGQGGVRVTSEVVERPVEQTVTLREERVEAENRAADRPLDSEEAEQAFTDRTVEMLASKEEADVRKEARVTGEVVVGRETDVREETISDSVRRTDVKVEKVKGSSKRG